MQLPFTQKESYERFRKKDNKIQEELNEPVIAQIVDVHPDIEITNKRPNPRPATIKCLTGKVVKYVRDDKHYHCSDIIQCEICHENFSRSNAFSHRKTKVHLLYEKVNNNIKELIFK